MNKVMLKIMLKMSFTLSVVVLTVLACSHDAWNLLWQKNNQISASDFDESGYLEVPGAKLKLDKNKGDIAYYSTNSLYGAYLAGRVANIRNDFPTAVEYYKIVLDKKPESNEINNWVYVLMTASGNLEEAAKYAQRELDNQKFGVMAPLVVSSYAFKHEDYARVHEVLKVKNDKVYHEMVYPFLEAWAYAGENKEAEAIAELDKIVTKGADIQTLKHFHKGLIYDYFNKVDEASKEFETINSKYPTEMSFRKLEVITDFYVRRGRPEMAEVLAKKYVNNSSLSVLLKDIRERISGRRSDEQIVIDTVQKGVADVMFNLNVMFRLANLDNMFAILFNGMSIYLNPDYDATKISMASVLESNGFYDIANDYYRQVKSDSGYYYIAQTRIVLNQHKENKLKEAKQTLADLLKAYPQDAQLWSEYGNILSSLDDQKEAIKAYKQSISLLPENDKENWSIYYALAVAYDQNGEKQKSEEYMQKTLELSNRDSIVLNYLGYSWLEEGKKIDEAGAMIVEAYNKYPLSGHIADSLGWLFYKTGNYAKAAEYLEQAADMNPANAVISDHLGDVYWRSGRKNEAGFQWNHALVLKEDAEMVDHQKIKDKIDNGLKEQKIYTLSDEKLIKELSEL